MNITTAERFWAKVDKDTLGNCWLWLAAKSSDGYGSFTVGSHLDNSWHSVKAHRYAYELEVGLIPSKLQLDHLCRNRACVNPDHLELVTSRENLLRGDTFQAHNARKTHCPQGHPYNLFNTRFSLGRRRCRECDKSFNRHKRARV